MEGSGLSPPTFRAATALRAPFIAPVAHSNFLLRTARVVLIPILGDADSSWHHGQTTRRTGNYLKLNNDFAYDHCTVARLEESASPRIGIRTPEAADCAFVPDKAGIHRDR